MGSGAVNLNIGCGEFYVPGWLNIDATDDPRIRKDLRGDVTQGLALPTGTMERIYLGHVLEHIVLEQVPVVMDEVLRLLVPGGEVMVVGPDCDKVRLTGDLQLISGAVHGAGRWADDVHQWECSERMLVEILADAGLKDVEAVPIIEVSARGWPLVSEARWQSAAYGWKGGGA